MSMKTTAVKKGDKYIINGGKFWCTNGPDADVIVFYAKTDSNNNKISAFIIETEGLNGFSRGLKLDKLGMRGSNTGELIFDNMELSDENILGEINKGGNVLMSGLNYERLVLSGGPVGIMQNVIDIVYPYVFERKQFNQPIGCFQLIQGKLADMNTLLSASRSFLYSTSIAADKGYTTNKDCASVILFCAENCNKLALDGIQLLGGNGYINDYDTGRLLRDAKLYEIGAGTSEIRRYIIGKSIGIEIMGKEYPNDFSNKIKNNNNI